LKPSSRLKNHTLLTPQEVRMTLGLFMLIKIIQKPTFKMISYVLPRIVQHLSIYAVNFASV
jgi:hypothetical protein